ncbi:hypothetical protein THRCLA_21537 [Thraustotheca clavata]|uniref:Uncharacterized protein n=1 Tax=Thraustotheca clavata TaxID=74557 RepID=A0A1V9ZW24_9STRA|nr:hypothetical protein THRCLA_21537 [Thraustotheca clavata]
MLRLYLFEGDDLVISIERTVLRLENMGRSFQCVFGLSWLFQSLVFKMTMKMLISGNANCGAKDTFHNSKTKITFCYIESQPQKGILDLRFTAFVEVEKTTSVAVSSHKSGVKYVSSQASKVNEQVGKTKYSPSTCVHLHIY